ncbi:hypothetical protein FB451DRAFT_1191993 [Mycena latifolia]|nr:hypothetical protein FB451DRAFT_1191993 [Mycena latifolia]
MLLTCLAWRKCRRLHAAAAARASTRLEACAAEGGLCLAGNSRRGARRGRRVRIVDALTRAPDDAQGPGTPRQPGERRIRYLAAQDPERREECTGPLAWLLFGGDTQRAAHKSRDSPAEAGRNEVALERAVADTALEDERPVDVASARARAAGPCLGLPLIADEGLGALERSRGWVRPPMRRALE